MNTMINAIPMTLANTDELFDLFSFDALLDLFPPMEIEHDTIDPNCYDELDLDEDDLEEIMAEVLARKAKHRKQRHNNYVKAKRRKDLCKKFFDEMATKDGVVAIKADGSLGEQLFCNGDFRKGNPYSTKSFKFTPNGENCASDLRKLAETFDKISAYAKGLDEPTPEETEVQLSESEMELMAHREQLKESLEYAKQRLRGFEADLKGQDSIIDNLKNKIAEAEKDKAAIKKGMEMIGSYIADIEKALA